MLGDLRKQMFLIIGSILVFIGYHGRIVNASEEFQVYRMQQYDLPFGTHFGSRSNQISMEARTINSKPSFISRRCVLIKLDDFTLERYRILTSQYAGSIIVILPANYTESQRQTIKSLEAHLLHESVKIPVYFILESARINEYYDYIDNDKSSQDSSAFQVLVDSIISDGFQFVINSPNIKQLTQSDFQAVNLQGKLIGGDQSDPNKAKRIPTIIITAHYDAFGLATSMSNGCDSNGSGVVALLELSRLLSSLYSNSKTIPPLNILFLLTAEGKFNYYGLKKWLEEQSEAGEAVGKIDLDDIQFAICLDSLGKSTQISDDVEDGGIFMHVSRPPKEGQASFEFLKTLETVANKANVRFELNHKKINLASDVLAWEHERFSLSKIPAMTLSHFQSHKDSDRNTMTDKIDNIDRKVLMRNIKLIYQSLIQYIYKNDDVTNYMVNSDLDISGDFVSSWMEKICFQPRTASLINKNHPLINLFFAHFNRYMQESLRQLVKIQAKEPEFVLYNEEEATLVIYNVKPAAFDFFLAMMVSSYVGLIYLAITNFDKLFGFLNRKLSSSKLKSN
ncbi:nicalin-1-like isoform X3 [Brachionus plicatilis]|uniref:BOS complex subunit NCLN n=1 Tax=Brachionus plicatilis TaxID=10195 RepID=A0A3M7S8Y6_BRAPC|nr:nicalin-1-like isoform X3 [Brachionus plicatilis]